MSAAILTIGKLAFAAMGLLVGLRLAATARAQGALGLHTVALSAICAGGLGLLVMPIAQASGSWPGTIAAEAGVRIGMLLLCVFIAGTFRPTPVGIAGAAAAGVLLVATIVWDLSVQSPGAAYDYTQPSSHANQLSIALPFLWATIESGTLFVRGRRRLQLGLVDPWVVRSYLVWSVATASFVGICALAMLAGALTALDAPRVADVAHALRGLLYLVISGAIWVGVVRRRPAPAAAAHER